MILYEYPFNERIRTYLRLQHLFLRLSELAARESVVDHHYALTTIFEVIDVALRADLKSDVLKDLDKQKNILNGFRGNPAIAVSVLDHVTHQLETCFAQLSALPGKAGQSLSENDWLSAIRSRIGIPGGTCEFDLPAYFAWQHHSPAERIKDLQRWRQPLQPLADSVALLLRLLRDSGNAQKVMAKGGKYEQNLPQGRAFQLLRLRINPALGLIPEISCNRLIATVRLMRQQADDRLQASGEDAGFELTLCA
ncbi:MAG: cell division protein ZapD [Burkholderiaceae bacterium]